MNIVIDVIHGGEAHQWSFEFSRMVNAGYVGRNQDEVRRHIEELAVKGIPGPKKTPTLYPVITRALQTDPLVEVYGAATSGEIEYVLLVENEEKVLVGLGSDHTDRHLEETDIPRAKQICPNIMSKQVWLLSDVEDHWDDLIMRSRAVSEGKEVPYQEGRLGLLMSPRQLMAFIKSEIGPLDNTVIFSGTLGMLTGDFVCGERFLGELVDERLNRRLTLEYEVSKLDYVNLD
ncbi:DUF2848 family protein [Desulfomonile tiedjei]|uniref:DUF2848 domain-containing protein n=1 Tax=Desulfomonile tiedjei (strain ATCC 49306 / DSM 6799 / DCB-1) TaxID=706587 RepID=I4C1H1_DESTA|nr:DUF2848 family protein [Desulfomonile tiedjei]AFM23412.1 Protein of unknown function (DUF2848) [Desulfomonile tiedjei DSM 6799]